MAPRLLFVPVSGAFGMGEYARSLAIALAFKARRPDAQIHFVISAQARYVGDVSFEHTILPASPTFHSREVCSLIQTFRPDVVVFDNAGRSAQLTAAAKAGAKIVYISARARQRRKAFRLRWMRILDEHWIAYPEFIAGPATPLERFKLRWLARPRIRYLDCLLPALPPAGEAMLWARIGVAPGGYVLVVPGGGTGHPGAEDAVELFLQAARLLVVQGFRVIAVSPAPAPIEVTAVAAGPDTGIVCLDLLPPSELIALIRGARAMLSNGGGTLIQAIACHTATISVPIASDQAARIRVCAARGLTRPAALNSTAMAEAMLALLQNDSALESMHGKMRALSLHDALTATTRALDGLLPR